MWVSFCDGATGTSGVRTQIRSLPSFAFRERRSAEQKSEQLCSARFELGSLSCMVWVECWWLDDIANDPTHASVEKQLARRALLSWLQPVRGRGRAEAEEPVGDQEEWCMTCDHTSSPHCDAQIKNVWRRSRKIADEVPTQQEVHSSVSAFNSLLTVYISFLSPLRGGWSYLVL